jgi:hypothetical protein
LNFISAQCEKRADRTTADGLPRKRLPALAVVD